MRPLAYGLTCGAAGGMKTAEKELIDALYPPPV